jgi:hypothetical protein
MVERHPMKSYLKPTEIIWHYFRKAKSMSGQVLEMDYGIVTFKM